MRRSPLRQTGNMPSSDMQQTMTRPPPTTRGDNVHFLTQKSTITSVPTTTNAKNTENDKQRRHRQRQRKQDKRRGRRDDQTTRTRKTTTRKTRHEDKDRTNAKYPTTVYTPTSGRRRHDCNKGRGMNAQGTRHTSDDKRAQRKTSRQNCRRKTYRTTVAKGRRDAQGRRSKME